MAVAAQLRDYCDPADQKAVKKAWEYIKVFYPQDDICVSDTIETTQATDLSIYNHLLELYAAGVKPIHSEYLSKVFQKYNCQCGHYRYVAVFSEPYQGIITCDILPIDRKIGIFGAPEIVGFSFKYDKNGEIYQVSQGKIHID